VRPIRLVAFTVAFIVLASCGSDEPTSVAEEHGMTETGFEPGAFSSTSTRIDNPWFTLRPGTQFVYQGEANRGAGLLPHRVVFTVTDLTKKIAGVETVVMWDRDFNEDVLAEEEITFHAQDDEGNVWNFGEYPEERESGRFVGAPSSWLAGVERALAGILMQADPRPGPSTYTQGWAPLVEFRDTARVARRGGRECVPHGCFDDLLEIEENAPLEPNDGIQIKHYARGVGNVLVTPRGGDEQETLVLVEIRNLDRRQMAQARRAALRLDRRARRHARSVFGESEPARPRLDSSGVQQARARAQDSSAGVQGALRTVRRVREARGVRT
jgi:hypothetical protein